MEGLFFFAEELLRLKREEEIGKEEDEMNLYICFSSLAPHKGVTIPRGGNKKLNWRYPMPSHAFPCSIVTLWSCLF